VQFGRGKDFCGSDRGFMMSSGKTRQFLQIRSGVAVEYLFDGVPVQLAICRCGGDSRVKQTS
jgi:hypothetical protein